MKRFVFRKWGWYLILLNHKKFKVKLLRFKKNGRLSLQYHNKRNELWLYLNGLDSGHFREIPQHEIHTYFAKAVT